MSEFDARLPYCTLTIAGIPVLYVNIDSVVIREWIFDIVPTIVIRFRATQEFFGGISLQENDIIEIQMGSRAPDIRELPVKAFFQLKGHTIDKAQEITTHELTGSFACTNLVQPYRFRAFANKPSSEVLKSIATELSLKPDIRITTNDSQTWLQSGTALDFVKHLGEFGYIADDDLAFRYTDREGNFVVTSVKTILAEKPMILRHWAEAYAEDIDPNELKPENKFYPFVGFTYKSITPIHNMGGGYGIREFKYDYSSFDDVVHDKVVGTIAELHQMVKELKGQANKVVETEITANGHANLMMAPHLNLKHRADFSSSSAVVLVKPHTDYKLGKLVKVELEFLTRGEKQETDGIYGGLYVIGGIVHQHESPNGSRMYLILMRGGLEKGIAMEDSDITSYKEK